jgi:tape measure domain-containing protein
VADEILISVRAEDNFSGVLGNFGNIMTGIKSAIDLAGDAFRTFTGFAMEGLDAIANYERLSISLQTLTASQLLMTNQADDMATAMDMASDTAQGLLVWVQELAINSPFSNEGVAEALRMAMAYGFTAEEAQRLVQAEIDYVSGTGQTEYAMQRISLALGQISATGKLTGQDMLQLTNVGVPVAQILADAFGVTTAEIIEMRTAGLIPAQDAIEAITSWMETNFQGAAENFATSWAGLKNTFEDLKAMGLREFFGGMFDALQPLVIELSDWLQGEGLDKIREWGAVLGEFTADIISQLPAAIARIEELKAAFDAGGISGLMNQLFGEIDEQVIVDWLDRLDIALGSAVEGHDWTSSGDAFGAAVAGFFTGDGLQSQDSSAIPAITEALNRWLLGAVGAVSWEQWRDAAGQNITTMLRDFFRLESIQAAWQQIGQDIVAGLSSGISFENMRNNVETLVNNVINYFKQLLGISSPSTVFMEIGRNIVLGLIMGWGTAIGSFLSVVQGFINTVLSLFEPVLNILGIDLNLGGSTGGTTGGMPGDTSHTPGGGTLGSGVTNNFYGPVYFGTLEQLGYDCPSPHPLVAQSSQSLLTSTIG